MTSGRENVHPSQRPRGRSPLPSTILPTRPQNRLDTIATGTFRPVERWITLAKNKKLIIAGSFAVRGLRLPHHGA